MSYLTSRDRVAKLKIKCAVQVFDWIAHFFQKSLTTLKLISALAAKGNLIFPPRLKLTCEVLTRLSDQLKPACNWTSLIHALEEYCAT